MSLLRCAFNGLKSSRWVLKQCVGSNRASISTALQRHDEGTAPPPASLSSAEDSIVGMTGIPTREQLQLLRELNDDPHGLYDYYDIDALCVDKRVPQPDAGFKQ